MSRRGARGRTLAHMEKLLATVGAGVAAACGGSYGVVDPMPPPAICPARNMTGSAAFVKDPSGDLLLAVRLDPPTRSDTTYFDDEPLVVNATIVSKGRIGSAFEMKLKPDPATKSIEIQAPVSCPNGKDGVSVVVSWTNATESAPALVVVPDRT